MTNLEVSSPGTVKLAKAYETLGCFLSREGQWNEARLFLEKAVRISKHKAPNSKHLAKSYQGLGSVMFQEREWDQGREFLRKAVQIHEGRWMRRKSLADCYHLLAVVSLLLEDYEGSCCYYRKTLKACLRIALPPCILPRCYSSIGQVLVIRGELHEAQRWFKKALSIGQSRVPRSLSMACILVFLANVCHALGDETRAWQYYKQSSEILAILARLLTPRSLDLAACYEHRADFLHAQGKRWQERDCIQTALEIREGLQPGTFQLVTNYFHLGWICYDEGERIDAMQWYQKSWNTYKELTDNRPFLMAGSAFAAANSLFGIGCIYDDERDYKQALQSFEMALEIYKRLGSDRIQLFLRLNPRPLPTMQGIQQTVALNPSRLVLVGNSMPQFAWCQALAGQKNDVQAVYYILREHPHIIMAH